MSSAVEVVPTRPTDRRGGDKLDEPVRAACWSCGATGVLEREVVRCHPCGRWIEIDDGEGSR